MTSAMKHYLFSASALGLSVFFIYHSGSLPRSAALLPRLIACLVAALSVMMAVQAYRRERDGVAASSSSGAPKVNAPRALCFAAMIAAYIYLIPTVGFFIMTPVYIVASYMYLRAVKFSTAVLISVAFSAFIYALFVSFLKLPVPLGFMEYFM